MRTVRYAAGRTARTVRHVRRVRQGRPGGDGLGQELRVECDLPYEDTSARRARRLTAEFLTHVTRVRGTAIPSGQADDAAVVVSELVTNATRHGHSECCLRLRVTGCDLVVEVHDDSRDTPPPRPAPDAGLAELAELAESGRGIAMVRHLSRRFEVVPDDGADGKTVRAVLAAG